VDRLSIAEQWRKSRAREEAVKRVRANSQDKSRAELRAMLEMQLARRGLDESRVRIEATLDNLQASRSDQIQTTVIALGSRSPHPRDERDAGP
jgi:hypothetical protein